MYLPISFILALVWAPPPHLRSEGILHIHGVQDDGMLKGDVEVQYLKRVVNVFQCQIQFNVETFTIAVVACEPFGPVRATRN